MSAANESKVSKAKTTQLSTFYINHRWYGIEVSSVQEIVKPLPMTKVPLAPPFVQGLINLRGQVATAIGLKELLGINQATVEDAFNVVCRLGGFLIALQVDMIGDVLEVKLESFETAPHTLPESVRLLLKGVYKMEQKILCELDMHRIESQLYGTKQAAA